MSFKLKLSSILLVVAFSTNAFAVGFTTSVNGFISNGDGTVTNTNTGLIWQACMVGMTWDNTNRTCLGDPTAMSWDAAMKLSSNFAGKTDWRVPNIVELNSIVDVRKFYPAINNALFPNAQRSGSNLFCSSTTFAGNEDRIWFMGPGSGGIWQDLKDSHDCAVYLVRGNTAPISLRLTDFSDNNDGTATHVTTGLTWQRCSVGQTWNPGGFCDGRATTFTYDDAAKLTSNFAGQTDWRLPTHYELRTIVDYSSVQPATNSIVFPYTPNASFWTITESAESSKYAWFVNFDVGYGDPYNNPKSKLYAARLVRGTLLSAEKSSSTVNNTNSTTSGNVDLTPTINANLGSVKMGSDLTYTATVTNKGTATANNVSLIYMMPPRWTNYSSLPSGCSVNGANVTCSLGSVNAGSSVSNSITVNYSRRGATSVGALVKTDNDTNNSNNMSRIITTITKY